MNSDTNYQRMIQFLVEGRINMADVSSEYHTSQLLYDLKAAKDRNGHDDDWDDLIESAPESILKNLSDDIVSEMIHESYCSSYLLPKSYFVANPLRIHLLFNLDPRCIVPIDYPEVFEPLSDEQLIIAAKENQSNFIDEYCNDYADQHYAFFSKRLGFQNLISIIFPIVSKLIKDKCKSDSTYKQLCKTDKNALKTYLRVQYSGLFEPAIKHAKKYNLVTIEFLKTLKKYGFDNFDAYLNISDVTDL
jgi:hypothetical protein